MEIKIEDKIREILTDEAFSKYHLVFEKFGFGLRIKAVLLSYIYPFENFLDEAGKPIVEFAQERLSGRRTKKHLSLRRFKLKLGLAPLDNSSGDRQGVQVGGSVDCRSAFWLYIFTNIEPARNRLQTDVVKQISLECDQLKSERVPIRLLRSRLCVRVCTLLFRELVKALCNHTQES